MHYNIDTCDDTETIENKNLQENEVKIKDEIETKDLIKEEYVEMIPIYNDDKSNCINYENFKLTNEEIDLKFESCDDRSIQGCEKVDVKQISSDKSYVNSANNEKEHEVNYLEINESKKMKKSNLLECDMDDMTNQIKKYEECPRDYVDKNLKKNIANESDFKHINSHKNIRDLKCTYCSKINLDNHLIRIHKCRDTKRKLYNCNQCSSEFLTKRELLRHKIKHGITDAIPILKCYLCTFETYHRGSLTRHVKIHQNMKGFKCTLCSKTFTQKFRLDDHLLRIHKYRDVRKKLYNCDHCSYGCLDKKDLLLHKIKHGITDGISIFKCYQCNYETYRKKNLIVHFKIHRSIKDFKCTYCSKEFTYKCNLERHILKLHKCGGVNCDQYCCIYITKQKLMYHKIKNGITRCNPIFKCYHCIYETVYKQNLIKHVKIHSNFKDFKCSHCSKEFNHQSSLKRHILKLHKCSDATEKNV